MLYYARANFLWPGFRRDAADHPGQDSPMMHPDTILHRGKIYVVDTADSTAETLAIRNGQIVAIGSSQESRALAGPETRVIDLEGAPSCRASSTVIRIWTAPASARCSLRSTTVPSAREKKFYIIMMIE